MKYEFAVIDIETTGLSRYKHDITWIGVGLVKKREKGIHKTYIFNMKKPDRIKSFLKLLEFLQADKTRIIWQNGKFDTLFILHKQAVRIPIHDDVMLLGTAYDLAAEHNLKKMAMNYLGVPDWDIAKKEKLSGKASVVVPYLILDVQYTWELYDFFTRHLTEEQWMHYKHILKPAYLAYRDIEINGIYLNKKQFKEVKQKYEQIREEKLAVLNAKYEINWNSSDQLQKVLFEEEKLPVIKRSKKTNKPSASADVLRRLAYEGHELAKQILEYRDADTLVKMFLNRWGDDAAYDGRIHPSFGLTNVRTGRTSCSDPNLQQVPRKKDIRMCFTAPPKSKTDGKKRVFFEADYSQLELRIAADYSGDPTMIRIYREGGDIHTSTARILTNGAEPSKEDRNKAKPVNFGYLYGMQAKGFVDYAFNNYGQNFSLSEAKQNRQGFFTLYNRLEPWHKEMEQVCEALGGVCNRFGRFRALPDIYSHDWGTRNSAIRKAINTPVQSTGSDLLICSAAQINKELRSEGVMICGTVHDSIVGECWQDDQEWVEKEIKRIMIHPNVMDIFGVWFKVPLEVDVGWGAWGSK